MRVVLHVFNQLKDSRFSGDISESLDLTIRDYNVCARQNSLPETKKAYIFIQSFSEPARTFFFMNSEDNMTFDNMVSIIMAEYDSDARREQFLSNIKSLKLKEM